LLSKNPFQTNQNKNFLSIRLANESMKGNALTHRFCYLFGISTMSGLFGYLPPLRYGNFTTPPNLYFLGEAESSSGKSHLIKNTNDVMHMSFQKREKIEIDDKIFLEKKREDSKNSRTVKYKIEKLNEKRFLPFHTDINPETMIPTLQNHKGNLIITCSEGSEAESVIQLEALRGNRDCLKKSFLGEYVTKARTHQGNIVYHTQGTISLSLVIQDGLLKKVVGLDFSNSGMTSRLLYCDGNGERSKPQKPSNKPCNDLRKISDVVWKHVFNNLDECSFKYFSHHEDKHYTISKRQEKLLTEYHNGIVADLDSKNKTNSSAYTSTMNRKIIHLQKVAMNNFFIEYILDTKKIPKYGMEVPDLYFNDAMGIIDNQIEHQVDILRSYGSDRRMNSDHRKIIDYIETRTVKQLITTGSQLSKSTKCKNERKHKQSMFLEVQSLYPSLFTKAKDSTGKKGLILKSKEDIFHGWG